MLSNLQAIILAAGKSTRFNTDKSKLLEKICGQQMILYPTKTLESMNIPTTLVVGYQKEKLKEAIKKDHKDRIHFVTQEQQHGTGHAILCARDSFLKDHILILNGDMPLITPEIIKKLYQKHMQTQATISFVIAHNMDPTGGAYGRVIKTDDSIEIIEAKNFKGDTTEHCCINAGVYIVSKKFLEENIDEIERNDLSKEFYFTDLIKIASDKKLTVSTISESFDRIRGINTFQELWAVEQVKRAELIKYWMDQGVRFSVAQNIHIDLDVEIGAGTYIGCGAHLLRGSKIGKNCKIAEFSSIENCILEDNINIESHCILKDSHIESYAKIGPFAHINQHNHIQAHAVIGNFVEIKNSIIGQQTKAKHLSYIGNTQIGSNVNIGAGTITCNFDGKQKHTTIIQDNVFIGSNNALIAPITIHENAYTAAGSTITHDVPANALGIARAKQINKQEYAHIIHKDKKKDDTIKESDDPLSFIAAVKSESEPSKLD